jgi:hypothetical protein
LGRKGAYDSKNEGKDKRGGGSALWDEFGLFTYVRIPVIRSSQRLSGPTTTTATTATTTTATTATATPQDEDSFLPIDAAPINVATTSTVQPTQDEWKDGIAPEVWALMER